MIDIQQHILDSNASAKEALIQLDKLGKDAIVFILDSESKLIGSLTDGDVRRGLIQGFNLEGKVELFINGKPKFIRKNEYSIDEVISLRKGEFKIIPVLDNDDRISYIINFRIHQSYLPVDAIVMAGGKGSRLMPLTENIPKPLLKVGDKTIIDHNVDRLRKFGVDDFWISVKYLGDQIEKHFEKRKSSETKVRFIKEDTPLGTIGAVGGISDLAHDYVLVTNSDILTTLNYEDFFLDFIEKDADMSVITIPYHVNVPYAVMETANNQVLSFKEKPTYTYYSNGGIYLIKKEILKLIPKKTFFNTTDLMEKLISDGGKLISYPIRQYWLDIGKHEDYQKAQNDLKHLTL